MAKPKIPSIGVRPNATDPYDRVDVLDMNRERRGIGPYLVASGIRRNEVAAAWKKYQETCPRSKPRKTSTECRHAHNLEDNC